MKINIKYKVVLLVIGAILIQIIMCNTAYGKDKENNLLNDYLVKSPNSGTTEHYALSFSPSCDSIYGGDCDETSTEEDLYEVYSWDNDIANSDVYCVVSLGNDFNVRYCWLHALDNMLKYIEKDGVSYQTIAEKNDSYYIKIAINALKTCASNIGTFSAEDNKIDKPGKIKDKASSVCRAESAFKNITGYTSRKKYKNRIDKCRRELQAAYDYLEETPYYGGEVYIRDDFETKSNYTEAQVEGYYEKYGERLGLDNEDEKSELLEIWNEALNGKTAEEIQEEYSDETSNVEEDEEAVAEATNAYDDPDKEVAFKQPDQNNAATTSSAAISDAVNDAEAFLERGNNSMVSSTKLQTFSQTIYNILLTIGIVLAVIIGMILGIKLMVAPIEQRVEAKKLLVPYVVGCIVVFGAFGVWKLIVSIVQGM